MSSTSGATAARHGHGRTGRMHRVPAAGIAGTLIASAALLGATASPAPANGTPDCSVFPLLDGAESKVNFTNTTPCNWTVPEGVTSLYIDALGGGGGGGGGRSVTTGSGTDYFAGGGGGGGQRIEGLDVTVVPGTVHTVTIGQGGAGGAGGVTGGDGDAGGTTSFGVLVIASGGGGGQGGQISVGGTGGGSGSYTGGAGTPGGGGGGGASTTQNGSGALTSVGGNGGVGATYLANSIGGGGGGGGVNGSAGGASDGNSGGYGGGVQPVGNGAWPRGGGGGGGGYYNNAAETGGNGSSGIIRIRYATKLTPATQTLTGTVGTAIAPTEPLGNADFSDPVTYALAADSPALPAGLTLDGTTGIISGKPNAQQATVTVIIIGEDDDGATGTSSVKITINAAGGGGDSGGGGTGGGDSGGGGTGGGNNSAGGTGGDNSGGSAPAPAPSTPTPTQSTAPALPTTPNLGPELPGSNPNLPVGGVPLGGSVFLVNGQPVPITVKPDAPRDATGLDVIGDGFTMRLVGRTTNDKPLGLTPDGALILEQDRTAYTEGTGFKPNSEVKLYVFSEPRFLGTVMTDANGSFRGSVPLPLDIQTGRHTLQSNGLAPDGAVRSLSLGVQVQAPDVKTARARTARTTVFFPALSSRLDASARKSLRALAAGRGTATTKIMAIGYVQPTAVTSNDRGLSLQRAQAIATYLKSIGVKGVVVTRGDGVAKETGAAGRKAIVTITYRK